MYRSKYKRSDGEQDYLFFIFRHLMKEILSWKWGFYKYIDFYTIFCLWKYLLFLSMTWPANNWVKSAPVMSSSPFGANPKASKCVWRANPKKLIRHNHSQTRVETKFKDTKQTKKFKDTKKMRQISSLCVCLLHLLLHLKWTEGDITVI